MGNIRRVYILVLTKEDVSRIDKKNLRIRGIDGRKSSVVFYICAVQSENLGYLLCLNTKSKRRRAIWYCIRKKVRGERWRKKR